MPVVDPVAFLAQLIAWAIPVVLAVTLHEVAHGYVARAFGDATAADAGRLSLNPLAHVDPIGTLLVPGTILIASALLQVSPVVFGWARPVPVNWRRLRSPRLGIALVALAGPGANLLMMLLWAAALKLALTAPGPWTPALIYLGQAGIIANAVIMLLNLVPIPPLDGSRVVTVLLPRPVALLYNRAEPLGLLLLLVLLTSGTLGAVLAPPLRWLTSAVHVAFGV